MIDLGSDLLESRQKNGDLFGRDCTGKTDGGDGLGRAWSNWKGERMAIVVAHKGVGILSRFQNSFLGERGQSVVFFLEPVFRKSCEIGDSNAGLLNGESTCCG